MDAKQTIEHADRIRKYVQSERRYESRFGAHAQVAEFLRVYAGIKSVFYKTVASMEPERYDSDTLCPALGAILDRFIDHVRSGLQADVSPERQAQIVVVSDLLSQAQDLLNQEDIHPAAPAVIIGACLEEFLRTWIENEDLSLGKHKPGLNNYAQVLRDAEFIDKQDQKDIIGWAGMRNDAAHGDWEAVSDKKRIALMLDGVNHFMRMHRALA